MGCFWHVEVVVVVWTVLDVVGDGPGMFVAALYDVVRDLTLLVVIGGVFHVRFESATPPRLSTVLPLFCCVQRWVDDRGW